MIKVCALVLVYFVVFALFEYINAVNMANQSTISIIKYAIKPQIFIFFTATPLAIWLINREIYNFFNQQFWFVGLMLAFLEFAAYIIGAMAFYRKLPTTREMLGFGLMLVALLIAYEK